MPRGRLVEALTPGCFFMVAVSYKLAWTAISSLLSQFSREYGPGVLLQLNVAYFLPSIPVLMLQTSFNDAMDRKLGGLARGSLLRLAVGLGGLAVLTAHFPAWATTQSWLLAVTAAVGVSYGVVFGTSYQLASRFPPSATVMLTTGFVSSGPIVLVLDLALKRGTYYTPQGMQRLFLAVAWITMLGLLAACAMVLLNLRLLQPNGMIPQRVELGKMLSGRAGSGLLGGGHSLALKVTRGRGTAGGGLFGPPGAAAARHRGELGGAGGGEGGHSGHGVQEDGHHTVLMGSMGSSGGGSGSGGTQHHAALSTSLSSELQHTSSGRMAAQHHLHHLHHLHHQQGNGVAASTAHSSSGAPGGAGGFSALQVGASAANVMQRGAGSDAAGGGAWAASKGAAGRGPTLGGGSGGVDPYNGYDVSTGKQRKPEVPLLAVAWRIGPAALSIFLSVGTSMLVFPFFTYMRSTGLLAERLPQVLFYVRLVGDIVGRLFPSSWQSRTVPTLLLWALVKTAMVPLLFGCIFTPEFTGGDLGAVVVVAVFWVLSGYVNTCSYLVAPTLVPLAAKGRASGLMTVAFQSSCFLALVGAAAVQQWSSARLAPPPG